eukprot:gene2368-2405_t
MRTACCVAVDGLVGFLNAEGERLSRFALTIRSPCLKIARPMTLTFHQDHPYPDTPAHGFRPVLVLSVLAICIFVAVYLLVAKFWTPEQAPQAVIQESVKWVPRVSGQIFTMDMPEFGKSTAYTAERLAPGNGLRDTLSLGDDKRFIRLVMQRNMTGNLSDFYLEMVRRSADSGLALVKSGQPQISSTRFGKIEIADVTVSGTQGSLSCAGLRLADHLPNLQISGLMCGMTAPLNFEKIACLVDRLELADVGDADLIDIFTSTDQISACKTARLKSAQLSAPLPVAPTPIKPAKLKKR